MRIFRFVVVAVLLIIAIYAVNLFTSSYSPPCLIPSSVECWKTRMIND
jgi:hypothetical protein